MRSADEGVDVDFRLEHLQRDAFGAGEAHLGILPQMEPEVDVGAIVTAERHVFADVVCGKRKEENVKK